MKNTGEHHVRRIGAGPRFEISWLVDVWIGPNHIGLRRFTRETDAAGALRFAKKWDLAIRLPEESKST